MHLRCSDEACHATLELHDRNLSCPRCGDLLEVVVDRNLPDASDLKRIWLQRRTSYAARDASGVWRFREFLPDSYEEVVTLGEGNNPVVRGQKASEWADVRQLSFKHLGWNPTGCFKDLGMTVGISEAKFLGVKSVGCASTGNTAASLAAYAARARLGAKVYLPAGKVSRNKMAQSLEFGAEVVEVEGNFDFALETLLRQNELYFLNSLNPFRIEGQKTAMFEMFEQMEWRVPDYVFVPGGNLGNTSAFGKAFQELKSAGLIEKAPRLVVVQAEGANPFARLWRSGASTLQPVDAPETAATAIRIGYPRSWKKASQAVRQTGGLVLDVTDEEIAEAKGVIGRDGIGCEPASATTLAAVRKLRSDGRLDREATVVAILTGHALKDTDFVTQFQQLHYEPAGAEVSR